MLVCIRILCFDLNNGQMTLTSKKVNFQGHGPADNDPNMRVKKSFFRISLKGPFGMRHFQFC